MYYVKFKGKKAARKALAAQFKSYEEARKAIRKYLRSISAPNLNLAGNFFNIAKI